MPILLGAVLLGLAVVLSSKEAQAAILRLSRSGTASKLGLDNNPTGRDRDRLLWASQWEPALLALLGEVAPGVYTSSGYRTPVVNAEIGGAGGATATRDDDSRHTFGLALDFGGIGTHAAVRAAARHLRDNAHRLPVAPRAVIAEDDHVHVEFWDPFLELDSAPGATAWMQENLNRGPGDKRFVALV